MKSTSIKVFISSTWIDLQPEREAVERVLQRLRQTKFVGMEYFGSRDKIPRHVSLKEVDQCELYVGIFGGRYGSGITEDEYRRARVLSLPCFIYFKDEAVIPKEQRESDAVKVDSLATLKDELRHKHTGTDFTTPDDLAAKLTADLHNWLFDRYVVQGIAFLPTDYFTRIQDFLTEYLDTPEHPVPFGGREDDIVQLDGWLDGPKQPPYLLLSAPAGRGKSAMLARWSQRLIRRDNVAVVFFPVSIRFRTNLASVVFSTVTARLSFLHGAPVFGSPEMTVEMWRGMMTDFLTRPLPDGRTLLLILDGVDEAMDWEPSPDLFPSSPHRNVRVIVSARYLAGDTDGSGWMRRLGWQRQNLARCMDLSPLTREGMVSALISMGFPLDRLGTRVDIIAELHRLSEGDPLLVRLYIDELWDRGEVAARLTPQDLCTIPSGLNGYFKRWWDDQRRLWGKDQPLREPTVRVFLKLLSCALGPLTREDVLHLTLPEVHLDTFTLDESLRPLARFVIGDGRQQGYVFSHPRMGSYFYDELTPQERRDQEGRFLTWGKETLLALDQGKLSPEKASPYIVQYYGTHLERSGSDPDAILALVSHGWRQAWYHLVGTDSSFLNDVTRAWQTALKLNLNAANTGESVSRLGWEIRCALCMASVKSRMKDFPGKLLLSLVENGIWSPSLGLAYAHMIHNPSVRAYVLNEIVPKLPQTQRETALQEALDAALAIDDDGARAHALCYIAPKLSEPKKTMFLEQAREAALAEGDKIKKAQILIELSTQLAEPQKTGFLKEAQLAALAVDYYVDAFRVAKLCELALKLPEPYRTAVWEKVQSTALVINNMGDRANALITLAKQLSESQKLGVLAEAQKAALEVKDSGNKAYLLIQLLGEVSQDQKTPLLEQAQALIPSILHDAIKAKVLTALAAYVSEPQRARFLKQAREIALEMFSVNGEEKARVLTILAMQLPGSIRTTTIQNILEAVKTYQIHNLQLGLRHPYDFQTANDQAIGLTLKLLDELCAQLSEQLREPMLDYALELSREILDSRQKAQALTGLAVLFPLAKRKVILGEALESALAIDDWYEHARALSALAMQFPDEEKWYVLNEARMAAINVSKPRERACLEVTLIAQEVHKAIEKGYIQILVDETYINNIMNGMEDLHERAQVQTDLVVQLPKEQRQKLIKILLETIKGIDDGFFRAKSLIELAVRLPVQDKFIVKETLKAIRAYQDEHACWLPVQEEDRTMYGRASLLHDFVMRLQTPQKSLINEALRMNREFWEDEPRRQVDLLCKLAEQSIWWRQKKVLQDALNMALDISDVSEKAQALLKVISKLPKTQKAKMLKEAKNAAFLIKRPIEKAEVLIKLVEKLPKSERQEVLEKALEAMRSIGKIDDQTKLLTMIVPMLSEEEKRMLLGKALMTVCEGNNWNKARGEALSNLAPNLAQLPINQLYQLWNKAFHILSKQRREDLLADLSPLMPLIAALGDVKALKDTWQAIRDVKKWWP